MIAVISTAGVVAAAAIPALLGLLRRAQGAVEAEGTTTRESVVALGAALAARIDGVKDELRSDVAELREDVVDVRAWQAGHDAEHMLMRRRPEQ
ncbi:hypothetical protein [Streptomyces sp. CB03911]|uniref:hypothetical protein n=1 Tax=Streptomyces sp. CB03911 TaxID=1804758 RepID=UPI00095D24AD|nr:hypothetical protein [Streptomyces sp. CB03911]OKI19304.1 hypothetical protein A6A07_07320 [Streptomyces sp. CB03911]